VPVGSDKDTTERLIDFALQSSEREYDDLCSDWRAIDSKAQGTAAIAGICITLMLAPDGVRLLQSGVSSVALWVSGVTILISLVISISVLGVREVARPPSGAWVAGEMEKISASGGLSEDKFLGLRGDCYGKWQKCIADVGRHCNQKATLLIVAHISLVVGLVCAMIVVLADRGLI
jgi:hypothetical protein